jgi:hypothetical protein
MQVETEQWHSIASERGPSGRAGHLLMADESTGKLYLYGGYCGDGGSTILSDLFELTTSTKCPFFLARMIGVYDDLLG